MTHKLVKCGIVLSFISVLLLSGLASEATPLPPLRRVNAPWFSGDVQIEQSAIFWLGKVTPTENYADVRIGYNNTELYVGVLIFDRRFWYDESPTVATLTDYDAVTLYLDKDGNSGSAPDSNSYRLVGQLNNGEPRSDWQAAWRGTGTQWANAAASFTTAIDSAWENGETGGFNNHQDNRGWFIEYRIPFTSLGLSGPPAQGSLWGLGVAVHDRDDELGGLSPLKTWPENLADNQPATWGQLRFGMPGYTPQPSVPRGNTTIRHLLNGVNVPDAAVGGTINNMCQVDPAGYIWNGWANFSDPHNMQVNVQNQRGIADWPCFAKYFITFPLGTVPTGKVILSATLTLHQFGNPGIGWGDPPEPSYLQILTVGQGWDENTLTWNTAPMARENVSAAWVDPLTAYGGDPGVPRTWNVSRAVAEAYHAGEPLSLAVYSADWPLHSGRYFWSSDHDEHPAEARPTLQVYWGDPVATLDKTAKPVTARQGQAITYALQLVGSGRALTLTDNLPITVSAPGPIKVVGGGSASYQVGAHRIVWTGAVAAGQLVTITFPVTLVVATPIAIVNQAILSDPVLGNSSDLAIVIANGQSVALPMILRH
ncbi:hypothetical protein TFLX_05995 [Thermoflexales bacterium]|nr:hypothetical protein TFLX_05995 [Thermoflexales bacterium]